MKLIAALAFLFSSVVDVPAPCSHAAGLDIANETPVVMNDSHAHHGSHADHGIDHPASETSHDNAAADHHAAADHQDHGCENGCGGGISCEGCTVTSAAISTADELHRQFVAHSALTASFVTAPDEHTAIDPPPPRT